MALTAFKFIRRLELYKAHFSTSGHCVRLIEAFPHLEHLGVLYLSWKPPHLDALHLRSSRSARRGKSRIAHFDIWCNDFHESDVNALTRWFISYKEQSTLRTLSVEAQNDSVQKVLRCGPTLRSIYLTLNDEGRIFGFEHLVHLQMLHIKTHEHEFPIRSVVSIIVAIASRHLQSLIIYVKAEEKNGQDQLDKKKAGDADALAYRELDDALCKPTFKELELTLCSYGPDSARAAMLWRQQLGVLLPKFVALGRFRVESTASKQPHLRWIDYRDGL